MRVGLWLEDEGRTLTQITELAATAARSGYLSVWLSERGGWDPLTVLTAVGGAVPDVGLGTSIVRSYPRHLREYLCALRPLLRGEPAAYRGEARASTSCRCSPTPRRQRAGPCPW